MAFLQLTDFKGTIEAVAFPKIWKEYEGNVKTDGIYGFKGKFESRQEKLSFVLEAITTPEQLEPEAIREAHIILIKEFCTPSALRNIMDTCITYSGSCSLMIHVIDEMEEPVENSETAPATTRTDSIIRAGRDFAVGYSQDFISVLKEQQAVSDVWFD